MATMLLVITYIMLVNSDQTDIDIMRGYMEQNMNLSECCTGFTLPYGINNTNSTGEMLAHFVDIASFAYFSLHYLMTMASIMLQSMNISKIM